MTYVWNNFLQVRPPRSNIGLNDLLFFLNNQRAVFYRYSGREHVRKQITKIYTNEDMVV